MPGSASVPFTYSHWQSIITSADSRILARTTRGGVVGALSGDGAERCLLMYSGPRATFKWPSLLRKHRFHVGQPAVYCQRIVNHQVADGQVFSEVDRAQ